MNKSLLLLPAVLLLAAVPASFYYLGDREPESAMEQKAASLPPAEAEKQPAVVPVPPSPAPLIAETAPRPGAEPDSDAASPDQETWSTPDVRASLRNQLPADLGRGLKGWWQSALKVLSESIAHDEDGQISSIRISDRDRAYLKDELARLLTRSYESKEAVMQLLLEARRNGQDEFNALIGSPSDSGPGIDQLYQSIFEEDIAYMLGRVWGGIDPEGTAALLRASGVTDGSLAGGWFRSRIESGEYQSGDLAAAGLQLEDAAVRQGLLALSVTDHFGALDAMLEMPDTVQNDQDLWEQLFLNARALTSDENLANWMELNADEMDMVDAGALFQVLLRYNMDVYETFYDAGEAEYLDGLLKANQFEEMAGYLSALRERHSDSIEVNYARDLMRQWVRHDPDRAYEWLDENHPAIDDNEMVEYARSILRNSYRSYGLSDMEGAVQSALKIEDEVLRADALSNATIANTQKSGAAFDHTWLYGLPDDFAKTRAVAGYMLGLSRNEGDIDLEANLKFQFMKNEFDMPLIREQVLQSTLSEKGKQVSLELLDRQ